MKIVIIKFTINNNKSVYIKFFLFFTIQNLHSSISFDIIELFYTSTCQQIFKLKALNISENI